MKPWDKFENAQHPELRTDHDTSPDIATRVVHTVPPEIPPPLLQQQQYGARYNQYQQGFNQFGANQYGSNQYGSNQFGYASNQYSPYQQQFGNQYNQYQPANIGQGTQQAFFVLEQLVQTISGFSQMLDSTFHATQSSFMAMLGLAEQFGNMKTFMASIFSIDSIKLSFKRLIGKAPPDPTNPKNSSRLPVILFIIMTFGLPWLMSRMLKSLENKNASELPLNLVFAHALFDYKANSPSELSFSKGDVIGVLEKCLENWNPNKESLWWKGRLQNGSVGVFPANHVKLLDSSLE